MAEALLKGLLARKIFEPQDVMMTDVSAQRLEYLAAGYGVQTSSNNLQAFNSEIIFLTIKPQQLDKVLEEMRAVIQSHKMIISIVAGIPVKKIDLKNSLKVVRAMPNTPALIGVGATAYFCNSRVGEEEKGLVKKMFSAIGEAVEVAEEMLNAVTALSGSGPAFVFRLIEAFVAAGIEQGLPAETARQLALQTFVGSAELVRQSSDSIETLVDNVTSPGGTTAAGRKVLEDSDYKKIIKATIAAAKNRADELGK